MIVKCGRKEIVLTEKDVIMFNGACYQITTQLKVDGWYSYPFQIAKGKAEKMIKKGELVKYREYDGLTYYRINLPGEDKADVTT
jgi:hypothetical protein